jgi:hypothetical protein
VVGAHPSGRLGQAQGHAPTDIDLTIYIWPETILATVYNSFDPRRVSPITIEHFRSLAGGKTGQGAWRATEWNALLRAARFAAPPVLCYNAAASIEQRF